LTVADTQFALARALVAAGRERTRALSLAAAARTAYATRHVLRRQAEVDAWLADHR